MWSGVEVGKLHLDHTPRWPPRITPWTALKLHQLLGRYLSQTVPDFDSGWIVNGGTARGLSDADREAYNAPYPDDSFKAGARIFPMLVVTDPAMPSAAENRAAWGVLEHYEKPFLTLFGDKDMVTLGVEKVLQARIPGAKGQPHRLIENAGHFLQEDAGEEIAGELLRWMGKGS